MSAYNITNTLSIPNYSSLSYQQKKIIVHFSFGLHQTSQTLTSFLENILTSKSSNQCIMNTYFMENFNETKV